MVKKKKKTMRMPVVYGRMGQGLAGLGMRELSGMMEMFQILAVIWVIELCPFAKINLKMNL